MKKSNFYLLLSLAMLFLMGSCSHTSQISRIQPGKLQYAQSVPEKNSSVALEQQQVPDATVNKSVETKPLVATKLLSENNKSSKKTHTAQVITKKLDKVYASAEKKITTNPLLQKATLKATKPAIERSLKLGIILIIVGAILVWVLPWPLSIIGWLMEIIGVIFLLIWLLGLLDSM